MTSINTIIVLLIMFQSYGEFWKLMHIWILLNVPLNYRKHFKMKKQTFWDMNTFAVCKFD